MAFNDHFAVVVVGEHVVLDHAVHVVDDLEVEDVAADAEAGHFDDGVVAAVAKPEVGPVLEGTDL